jgi:branched-chain amino acid transport system permease protein
VLAPLLVGAVGMAVERYGLRNTHKHGHVAELLLTFGLAFAIEEIVSMIWGKSPMDYRIPAALDFPAFTVFSTNYPAYKIFMLAVSVTIFVVLLVVLKKTRVGLIVQAALVTQSDMAAMLGPILFVVIVFGGLGSLPGAFIASLLIGLIQTFAVALNGSLASAFGPLDPGLGPSVLTDIWNVTIAQIAPILPYVLLVLILIVRPMGLLGTRET